MLVSHAGSNPAALPLLILQSRQCHGWVIKMLESEEGLVSEQREGVRQECMRGCALPMQYDDVWERRDVLGVHPQKQDGFSWVGACIPAGRLFPADFDAFADVADK